MFIRQIADFITDLWLEYHFSKPADFRNNISTWYRFGTIRAQRTRISGSIENCPRDLNQIRLK